MAIPSLVQGMIETENGKVFELDSPKGSAWLESISSFRFEPSGDNKPYTVRKEASAYWYGCRKVAGKVRKKYIGKSSEVSIAKLEEIAGALEIPPVPRANKVAEGVAEGVAERVAEGVAERVAEGGAERVAEGIAERVAEGGAERVAEGGAEDRLTALELQVANLQKAIEALQEALPGKLESGDSLELPKVDNEVADERLQNELGNLKNENERLQNELGNLKNENERLRGSYATLLESSTHVTNKLQQEVQELRSQLETERADREEIEAEFADLKQKAATASELPEAADLLNQLKTKRKKSTTSLADIEAILGMIEEF
jgi:predicted  nucleic acid-binding Zn-ribbon protein